MDLLTALRAGKGRFLSGAELALAAGVTRAAVWKHVEELRRRGYGIEARPRLGYRLVSAPDRPCAEEVRDGLAARVFGREVIHLETTASTNDEARRLGQAGWPEGTVVAAEEQTAGRGRLGRRWSSPAGGLCFSMILRPGLALADLGPLTIVAAAALRRAILAETGLETSIKWPNDLMAGGRKLAGILAEASGELGRADLVVVGIGLNVNQADFPRPLRGRAVSLRQLLGREVRRVPILRAFLASFEDLYLRGRKDGFAAALAEAAANTSTLGRPVRVRAGGRLVEGVAVRLDPDGALVVALADGGGEARIHAGEVEEAGHGGRA
ncbi:MAG: biotin--[acetyl-CoA-carboxylase] ligase [Patescibacteria group bacterium]